MQMWEKILLTSVCPGKEALGQLCDGQHSYFDMIKHIDPDTCLNLFPHFSG